MNDDDMLSAMSEHLGQLSGQGNALNCLNKWEKVVFFADELWIEVNSAGLEGYLYYHGAHFEKAYTALEVIHAEVLTQILNDVRQKFPKGCIPKSMDAIQNTMDVMEEQGINFETQDDIVFVLLNKDRIVVYLLHNARNGAA